MMLLKVLTSIFTLLGVHKADPAILGSESRKPFMGLTISVWGRVVYPFRVLAAAAILTAAMQGQDVSFITDLIASTGG